MGRPEAGRSRLSLNKEREQKLTQQGGENRQLFINFLFLHYYTIILISINKSLFYWYILIYIYRYEEFYSHIFVLRLLLTKSVKSSCDWLLYIRCCWKYSSTYTMTSSMFAGLTLVWVFLSFWWRRPTRLDWTDWTEWLLRLWCAANKSQSSHFQMRLKALDHDLPSGPACGPQRWHGPSGWLDIRSLVSSCHLLLTPVMVAQPNAVTSSNDPIQTRWG